MRTNKDPIQLIFENYYNNPAAFTTRFTNIFKNSDGTDQELYPLQLEFLNGLKPHERIIAVVKCRQSGFSTCIQAKALHAAYFLKTNEILITSSTERQSLRVLDKVKKFFYSMPEFLRPEFVTESKSELELPNGAKLYSLPASPDACRGFTGTSLLDEYGLKNRQDSEALWEALLPCITATKNGSISAVGTPKGKDCLFYDLVNPKRDDDGNITGIRADKVIKVMWEKVPHIKRAVIELDLRNKMPAKSFEQEYCCSFSESVDNALFPYEFVMEKLIDESLSLISYAPILTIDTEMVPDSLRRHDLKDDYPGGIIASYDLAMTGDGSIVGIFGIDREDNWQLLAYHKFPKGTDINAQINFTSRLCLYFCCNKLIYDSTGALGKAAMGIIKDKPIASISKPFEFNQKSKSVGYAELRSKFELGEFYAPKIDEMIREFSNLGFNPVTEKIGAMGSHRNHDDWPSVFMMAYQGRKRGITEAGFTFI